MTRPKEHSTIHYQQATCPSCDIEGLHKVLDEQGARDGADPFGCWRVEYLLRCDCGHRWRHSRWGDACD